MSDARTQASEVNVREARQGFRALIDRVAAGEEVVLLRHGKPVARLVPPVPPAVRLPKMAVFRNGIRVTGPPLSRLAAEAVPEEKY